MGENAKQPLVVSSMAGLWNTYMGDSSAICLIKHFLNNVDDTETKDILQYALNIAEQHIKEIEDIFHMENIPIPDGFGAADVNLDAPRLFTDAYYLLYLSTMSGFGMDAYSVIIRYTARPDIQDFFVRCLNEATDLLRKVTALRLSKGQYLKAPRVEISKKKSYVGKDSFISGIMKEPRPFITREVTNIFAGMLMDIIWRAMSTGFGQVSTVKVVKDFMFEGVDITSAHFEKFSELLNREHIPVSSFSDSFVTDSTTSPFSEKLMMFHIVAMCALAIGVDGVALASSLRSDLFVIHSRFAAEIIKYADKGTKIMIDNRWFEQPLQVIRHQDLASI
jgi:hypothetical protein